MSHFGRMLALLILAVVVTAAMVMLITYRMMGDMGPREVTNRWTVLLLEKAPVAEFVKKHWGSSPPLWVKRLAVVWAKADMLRWWWLPLVFMGVRMLVIRTARRRMQR